MIGVLLIIGFVIALFYNPKPLFWGKNRKTQNNGGHRWYISTS
jgi:hypothetical protein